MQNDDDLEEVLETAEHLPAGMWEPELVTEITGELVFDGEKLVVVED